MPTYTTPPGTRFDLSSDGTTAIIKRDDEASWVAQALSHAMFGAQGGSIISRAISGSGGNGRFLRLRFLFPEPRNLLGMRWNGWTSRGSEYSLGCRTSVDTTTGEDGTWLNYASHGGWGSNGGATSNRLRSGIVSNSINDVKGLEFLVQNNNSSGYTGYFTDIHVYGVRQASGDHLQFWHPTLDQPLPGGWMDFGDILRGVTTASRQFRVKNVSTTQTANGVNVSYSDLDGAPFEGASGQISDDDTDWFPNIVIGNLAPGAVSTILYHRVTPGIDRQVGFVPAAGRLLAIPTSWST